MCGDAQSVPAAILATPLRIAAVMLATLATMSPPRARAADAPPVQAVLELFVNTMDEGTVLVAFSGENVLVAVAALEKARIQVEGGARQTIGGNSFVDLGSLAPGIAFHYDENTLALQLTVDPHLFATNTVNLQRALAPHEMTFVELPSAFVNYAFNGVTTGGTNSASLFTEQGANLGGLFFDNTFTFDTTGLTQRGNTSIIEDDRDKLTRLTFGDISTTSSTLGGPVTLGGIGYSRNFDINPYFLPYPTQRFAGIVNTPSTADIYVNGQYVRTIDLPPGTFNLLNIPGVTGAGVTRVVIRDAFGQRQDLASPYYQSAQLLAPGLSSFSYNLGMTRDTGVSRFGDYQRPALAAAHDYGFSDWLTAGGFVQGDSQLAAGGPDATIALPLGALSFAEAASGGSVPFGWSSFAEYDYQAALFNVGVNATYMSSRYANLSLTPAQDRARWQIGSFAGVTFGRWDVLLQVAPSRYRDAGRNDQGSLRVDNRLTDLLSASLTLGQSRQPNVTPDTSILLGLTYSLGPYTVASASAGTSTHEGSQVTAQASRSLPLGPGYGYFVQTQAGENAVQQADLQYQTTYGSYELDGTEGADTSTGRLSASGSLVAIGGEVKPSVPLQNAYALVRVPGVAGVTGYLSNQEVGRTDANGDLLVPNLLSYYGNRIEINDQDVPSDYSIDSAERVVAPGYRAGAVVDFPVRRFRAYLGTLIVKTPSGPVVPAYGDLAVVAGAQTYSSPIGEHGEFYLDGLPPGDYPATITAHDVRCAFTFAAPQSGEAIVRMNEVACEMR